MTTFADGVSQWGGTPVGVNPVYNKIMAQPQAAYPSGRAWFVNPNSGNGNGSSPGSAYTTMAQAFASVNSGDIIYCIGDIREQLVTPVQVFDVTIVGCGNRPRNADAAPLGGQYAAVTWRAPASGGTAAQATVRVLQQGWRFVNILFNAIDLNAAMIELVRNAGAGDAERDASHASIIGCRFAGAGIGVRITAASFTENPFNILIADSKFNNCTYGILASAAQPLSAQLANNWFQGCTNAITAKLQASVIGPGNVVQGFTAANNSGGIDLRSGAGNNFVTGNYLGGAFSNAGGYNGESGDNWWGNFADVTGGVTQADPA